MVCLRCFRVNIFDVVLGPCAAAAEFRVVSLWGSYFPTCAQEWMFSVASNSSGVWLFTCSHPHSLTFSIIFSPGVVLLSSLKFKHRFSLGASWHWLLRVGPSLTGSCGIRVGDTSSLLSWQPIMNGHMSSSKDQTSASLKLLWRHSCSCCLYTSPHCRFLSLWPSLKILPPHSWISENAICTVWNKNLSLSFLLSPGSKGLVLIPRRFFGFPVSSS